MNFKTIFSTSFLSFSILVSCLFLSCSSDEIFPTLLNPVTVSLTWQDTPNTSHYFIKVVLLSNLTQTYYTNRIPGTRNYQVIPVEPGVDYQFQVYAYDFNSVKTSLTPVNFAVGSPNFLPDGLWDPPIIQEITSTKVLVQWEPVCDIGSENYVLIWDPTLKNWTFACSQTTQTYCVFPVQAGIAYVYQIFCGYPFNFSPKVIFATSLCFFFLF